MPGATGRLTRLGDVLGADFRANAVEIAAEREGVTVEGFAALPTLTRANALGQYLFVNGRPVRDKLLLGAVRAAYADYLPRDRHPLVALFVTLDAREVDVNVHPAKAEVRFRNAGLVRALIVHALKAALAREGTPRGDDRRQRDHRGVSPGGAARLGLAAFADAGRRSAPRNRLRAAALPRRRKPHSRSARRRSRSILRLTRIAAQNRRWLAAPAAEALDHPLGAARAQVHETYIVAQTRDGLVIVDQHAAHERIVYEKLKAAIDKAASRAKCCLSRTSSNSTRRTWSVCSSMPQELARYGVVLESFGPGAVALRETPALLGEIDGAGLVRDLAEHIGEWDETLPLERRLMHVAATMACHGSVRAGRRLKAAGDECAVARDGSHAEFRPMQSRPSDLCRTQAHRYRAAVRTAVEHDPEKACPGLDPGVEAGFPTRSCSTRS